MRLLARDLLRLVLGRWRHECVPTLMTDPVSCVICTRRMDR